MTPWTWPTRSASSEHRVVCFPGLRERASVAVCCKKNGKQKTSMPPIHAPALKSYPAPLSLPHAHTRRARASTPSGQRCHLAFEISQSHLFPHTRKITQSRTAPPSKKKHPRHPQREQVQGAHALSSLVCIGNTARANPPPPTHTHSSPALFCFFVRACSPPLYLLLFIFIIIIIHSFIHLAAGK
jgi:hypothetical protein